MKVEDDILVRLKYLHGQATEEAATHYYGGRCVSDAINEITALARSWGLRCEQERLRSLIDDNRATLALWLSER